MARWGFDKVIWYIAKHGLHVCRVLVTSPLEDLHDERHHADGEDCEDAEEDDGEPDLGADTHPLSDGHLLGCLNL